MPEHDTVTLPQFRALVVLDHRGGRCRVGDLAAELLIQPSTATRMCDRLVRRHLVRRRVVADNRREVDVILQPTGKQLVDQVTSLRRHEIAAILSRVPSAQRRSIVDGLTAFSEAAGPELAVSLVPW